MRLHVCLCIALSSSTAFAIEPSAEERARGYYQEGLRELGARRFLEAQAAFSAGYELSRLPRFLWNMAECARMLGDRDRARKLYTQFLSDAADDPERDRAEDRLRELGGPLPPERVAPEATAQPAVETTIAVSRPWYGRWWIWATAAAVGGAVLTAVILTRRSDEVDALSVPPGTLDKARVQW